jgi:aspartyl protease family protein
MPIWSKPRGSKPSAMGRQLDQASRIGRSMLLGAWILAFVLMVALFDRLIERQNNPNQAPAMTQVGKEAPQVVLRRNRAGHYVANGRINGLPVRFLLDTGATDVALPLSLARQMGLKLGPGPMSVTANGSVRTWSTLLDQVDLGGLVVHQVRASVLPNMTSDEALLGMSYLKHLEFSQRGDTLTLRPHLAP